MEVSRLMRVMAEATWSANSMTVSTSESFRARWLDLLSTPKQPMASPLTTMGQRMKLRERSGSRLL